MKLSETHHGQAWIAQFEPDDAVLALSMLDRLLLVSTSDFRLWTAGEILRESKIGRMALYAEREFPQNARFFDTLAPGIVRRAVGNNGPALVKPQRGSMYVGSEGIISQLVSELAKRQDANILLTPGPNRLRPMKSRGATRRLAIVTDVIGSGNRIRNMLDAMWRTETLRSWWAHRAVQIEILIFSYAATAKGLNLVKKHRLSPKVLVNRIVPTIHDTNSSGEFASRLIRICKKYDPRSWNEQPGSLGYGNAATLLAFAHGCPNTTPRLFWKGGRNWRPLFPNRSASELDGVLSKSDIADFGERLVSIKRGFLSDAAVLRRFDEQAREALLLLAAISHGIRGPARLAVRTGLSVSRITVLLDAFEGSDWIDAQGTITALGLAELRAAERVNPQISPIPFDRVSMYFPT